MLGLGLSLTNAALLNQNNRLAGRQLDVFKAAIGERRLVEAQYEGKSLVMAPYALSKSGHGNGVVLSAVVLRSSDAVLNSWMPQDFEIQKLSHEKTREETFLPSQAFDPSVYGDRLILPVDLG